jgi:ribosome biogenesis GTPase / thiamine phosphate phosphatase
VAFDLVSLGWNDSFECPADHIPARVTRVDRGACDVIAASGELRVNYSGALKRAANDDPVALPCVGDWVAIDGEVRAVLERRTAIVRAGVTPGSSHGQVLAANIDIVYIAEATVPEIDLGRIERFLALAWESGAQPVVVITKADLADVDVAEVEAVAPGATVCLVSSMTGAGLDAVRLRPGQTAVVLGKSGAGKSTLVNALSGTDVMAVNAIRDVDGRGRHTTVHRELIVLPDGGMIIDTPGLRSVGLYDADDALSQVFAEIEELAADCRFSDCGHQREPGCAVLAALASGELTERRLESWRKLQREARWIASRTDARIRQEDQAMWKARTKAVRGQIRP